MRDLIFVQACPDDCCFWWQTAVQLNNLRKFGLSDKYHALVFLPFNRDKEDFSGKWRYLQRKYPEAHFHFYRDELNITDIALMIDYIPLLRPYCLQKFCEEYDTSNLAIFYFDSDVIFTKKPDLEKLLDDDINYLSYTGRRETNYNYICADHFDSKEGNIRADKYIEYVEKDVLGKMLSWFNITKDEFIKRKDKIGGAQYLLKSPTPEFFKKVYDGCIVIRTYLSMANQEFMFGETKIERENNGWQSWCADMWSVLFNLWQEGKETTCPEEMDFCWATDRIDNWEKCSIYHDSGGTHKPIEIDGVQHRLFHKKGELINGKWSYMHRWDNDELRTPFVDDLSFVSKEFCSSKYVEEILETKNYLLK